MSFSAVNARSKPALAIRLTVTLGLIMLAVGSLFSAIYFFLSVSLYSRLSSQHLDQKAKSAEIILQAVSNSKETVNSMTYLRNLQKAGFQDDIAVFSAKGKLVAHSDELITAALGKYATDPKMKLPEVEEQNDLLRAVQSYRKTRPSNPYFVHNNANYIAFAEEGNTILVALTAQKPKLLTLAVSFLLLCLLGVGINVLFVYHYGHSLAQSLAQIVRGIDVDSLRPDSIDAPYQEVDALLHAVDERLKQENSASPAVVTPAAPATDQVFQELQKKLFDKPFPRMQQYELAVYPRRPRAEMHEFISGVHDQGHIDVLIGVTESDQLDALVAKHRLQERFWALAKENLSADALARNLWTYLIGHSELVPGILFARLNEAGHAMEVFRAGAIHLFEVTPDGTCSPLSLGSTQFGSDFTAVEQHALKDGSHFIMVSHDAFNAMEVSESDFAEMIGKLATARSGKLLLAGLLERIHQKLPAGETVPGLLAVLSEKK